MTEIPDAEMGAIGFRGRSLVCARPHELGIEALCDCGTTTILTVDPEDIRHLGAGTETSYTCGTCQSVHWLTLLPLEETA